MRIKKETLKDIQFGVMSVFAGAFAFVWWSVLYPELCFPDDTYEVVYEDADMAESGGADRMKQNGKCFRRKKFSKGSCRRKKNRL